MADREIRIISHTALPVVLMAASRSAQSSRKKSVKEVIDDTLSSAADARRTEVLSEYTGDDVSPEEYEAELERTAEEAEKYGHALVPRGSYGDTVTAYLKQHAPDVEIQRYGEPERLPGAESEEYKNTNVLWQQKRDDEKNKELREEKFGGFGTIINYASAGIRLVEGPREFATASDLESDNPPYADMDFVTVGDYDTGSEDTGEDTSRPTYSSGLGSTDESTSYTGEVIDEFMSDGFNEYAKVRTAEKDIKYLKNGEEVSQQAYAGAAGHRAPDSGKESGLGSTDESTSYTGEVLDEFMSTGFNEFAKVRTADGDVKYLKNGEETSQQAYAAASGSRAPEKEPPAARGETGQEVAVADSEDVYTPAGKEWTREEHEDGKVQIYENGIPLIDYGEDEDIVEKQRERAENAYRTAKQQWAMPEYTDTEESEEEEEYKGGILDRVRDTVSSYISGDDKTEGFEDLVTYLHDIQNTGESALVVTDKQYEEDVEAALSEEGIKYRAKDAL